MRGGRGSVSTQKRERAEDGKGDAAESKSRDRGEPDPEPETEGDGEDEDEEDEEEEEEVLVRSRTRRTSTRSMGRAAPRSRAQSKDLSGGRRGTRGSGPVPIQEEGEGTDDQSGDEDGDDDNEDDEDDDEDGDDGRAKTPDEDLGRGKRNKGKGPATRGRPRQTAASRRGRPANTGSTSPSEDEGDPASPLLVDAAQLGKRARKEAESIKKDKSLAEFLLLMQDYQPMIPDAVTEYYLQRAGFQCQDIKIKRLLALAAQNFIADMATDAYQHCKIRQQSGQSKGSRALKDKKTVLTMEDLAPALNEYGINSSRSNYYQ